MSAAHPTSCRDRTSEFRQWQALTESSPVVAGSDVSLPTKLSFTRKSVLESNLTVDDHGVKINRDTEFYSSISMIMAGFDELTSIYPLELDNHKFQALTRQMKDMFIVAEALADEHSLKGSVPPGQTNQIEMWWKLRDAVWGNNTEVRRMKSLSDHYKLISPNKTYEQILEHRKVIITTLQTQLVAYLQRVDQIRKEGFEFQNQSFFTDKRQLHRRKRLGELLKCNYSTMKNDETRKMVLVNCKEERKNNKLILPRYEPASIELASANDKWIKANDRGLETFDSTFIKSVLSEQDEHVDVVNITRIKDQPIGDQSLDSNAIEDIYQHVERDELPPNEQVLPSRVDTWVPEESKLDHESPKEMIKLDDLITNEAPLLTMAQQSMTEISSMLNVFVHHISIQAEQASEMLATTEASAELISDSIVQLKEAIKKTEKRQLYFVLLFGIMVSICILLDMIL